MANPSEQRRSDSPLLALLVRAASSKATKGIIFLLWAIDVLLMVHDAWVSASDERVGGAIVHQAPHWEFERISMPTIWLSLIGLGYFGYHFKKYSQGYYGLVEIMVGVSAGLVAISRLHAIDISALVAAATSAYVIVRGATNVSEAVQESQASRETLAPQSSENTKANVMGAIDPTPAFSRETLAARNVAPPSQRDDA